MPALSSKAPIPSALYFDSRDLAVMPTRRCFLSFDSWQGNHDVVHEKLGPPLGRAWRDVTVERMAAGCALNQSWAGTRQLMVLAGAGDG